MTALFWQELEAELWPAHLIAIVIDQAVLNFTTLYLLFATRHVLRLLVLVLHTLARILHFVHQRVKLRDLDILLQVSRQRPHDQRLAVSDRVQSSIVVVFGQAFVLDGLDDLFNLDIEREACINVLLLRYGEDDSFRVLIVANLHATKHRRTAINVAQDSPRHLVEE